MAAGRRRRHVRHRAPDRQLIRVLRRLRRAAIHCLGHRLEHPRRLYRLCELRHRGILRARRLHHGRPPQADLPALAADDADRRDRVRYHRPRHRLSDTASARSVLLDRHARVGGGGTDPHHQLGLRRRCTRRVYRAAGAGVAVRHRLYPIPLPGHAGIGRDRPGHRACHRALASWLRLRHHPRRRGGRRGVRRTRPSA